jgi:hypothetical protein
MTFTFRQLEDINGEIVDAARGGNTECAFFALGMAYDALDCGAPSPALEYLRDCIGRVLAGENAGKAFNLPKRSRGGQLKPYKWRRDDLLRFEVGLLHLGAAALGLQDKVDGIAERLGVSREEAIKGGKTMEDAVHHVAGIHGLSSETVHTAYYGRR